MNLTESQRTTASSAVGQRSAYLDDLHARIAHRFRRPEVKERVQRYLTGLLAEIRRKNGWQMAQTIGEAQPRSTQRRRSRSASRRPRVRPGWTSTR